MILSCFLAAGSVSALQPRTDTSNDAAASRDVTGSRPMLSVSEVETPPRIDGRLTDAIWENAAVYTDFRTFEPDIGSPSSEPTFAYAAYDRENLYFAFRCTDSQPRAIKASMTKRDNIFGEDLVAVFLDTYHDSQSAYVFMANPYGIQADLMMNSDGNGNPQSADFIWESKGTLTENGYTVEMKIPLQSIRFPERDVVTMGVGVHRQIIKKTKKVV